MNSSFSNHPNPNQNTDNLYRKSVVACFIRRYQTKPEEFLVLERFDTPNAWQFPQGGVEPEETYLSALYREMKEELGCNDFTVKKKTVELVSYDFPQRIKTVMSTDFKGQQAYWYLCEFNDHQAPYLDLATDKEFRRYQWVELPKVYQYAVSWKKQAYLKAMELLGFDLNLR